MPNRKSDGVVVSAQLLEDTLTSILVDPTKDTIEALIGGMMDEADKENRRRLKRGWVLLSVITANSTYTDAGYYSSMLFARLKQSYRRLPLRPHQKQQKLHLCHHQRR